MENPVITSKDEAFLSLVKWQSGGCATISTGVALWNLRLRLK